MKAGNSGSGEDHLCRGVSFYDLGKYPEAEREYREAISINPDYAEAHGNLGILLAKLGRNKEARAEIEKAEELFEKQGRQEDAEKARGLLKKLPER